MSRSNQELKSVIDFNSFSKEDCIKIILKLKSDLVKVTAEKSRLEQKIARWEEMEIVSLLDRDVYERHFNEDEDQNDHDNEDEYETLRNNILDKKYKRKYVVHKK